MTTMYRTPTKPKGVGGFNWKPLAFGFFSIALTSWLATQFIAHRLGYAIELGTPLVRSARFAIYEPMHWLVWVLKYAAHDVAAVRQPVLMGMGIGLVGALCSVGAAAILTLRRTKRLGQGADDLHGSARFATKDEIEEIGLLRPTNGVFVGGYRDTSAGFIHYLRHDGPEHVLGFAPTRAGKGVTWVIPTALTWPGSLVTNDQKGELWALTAGYRASQGHVCFKFSPAEEESSRFNPLAEVRIGTNFEIRDAQNIAEMLCRKGNEGPGDEHWITSASSLITGLILHVCYESQADGGACATLTDLAQSLTPIGEPIRDFLQNTVMNFDHDPRHKYGWRDRYGAQTTTHPIVQEKIQEMLNREDREFSSVLSTAKTAMTLFSDPLVQRAVSGCDFRIDDLVNFESPVSLYIVAPPSDKDRLRPIVRLLYTQIVNRLTEKMNFDRGATRGNRHRLLLLVDEFPQLKRMQIFADALAYMAGYGIKAFLITQDVEQLIEEYGQNQSIVSNCHIRAAFAPNTLVTAEMLSDMTGKQTVAKASFNYSGGRLSPMAGQVSESVEYVERPLLTADEVLRLPGPKKNAEGRIEKGGDMLVFSAGYAPIYATQSLYFLDPDLLERSKIPAPTELPAIFDGALSAQPPYIRHRARTPAPVVQHTDTPVDGEDRFDSQEDEARDGYDMPAPFEPAVDSEEACP